MRAKATAKSFIEILEDEIRADIKRELRAELQAEFEAAGTHRSPNAQAIHEAARLETWLASHVGPITFKTTRKPYGSRTHTSRDGTAPSAHGSSQSNAFHGTRNGATHTAETAEEMIAVELLSRHAGRTLGTRYTDDDLKGVWRKAALKTHPDRFVGADTATVMRATALFRELAAAYELLSSKAATNRAPATAA